jgi:predicted RNA binding protein YcfA (HicA-like mRNA interferase family)
MTRLPAVSGAEAVKALERGGFVHVSTRGGHAKLRRPEGGLVIVPLHRTLAVGTLASILRQAGLAAEDFRILLK